MAPAPLRALLLALAALLPACAVPARHVGRGARSTLQFNSVDTSRATNPPLFQSLAGEEGAASAAATTTVAASQAVTVTLVRLSPLVLALLESDEPDADKILQRELLHCATLADEIINHKYFNGQAPTPEQCREQVEVVVDGCPEKILVRHLLGQEKHKLALDCAREVLKKRWKGQFSIEQRYRYYPGAEFVELVSAEEEARLIAQGCTRELWRTIKPDLVLHGADHDLTRSVLTLDFKFPCKETKAAPKWTKYGPGSAYEGRTQGAVYKEALGGETYMISPKGVHE